MSGDERAAIEIYRRALRLAGVYAPERVARISALLEDAAALDHTDALFALANWRHFGIGSPRDDAAAADMWTRAAAQGHPEATFQLAVACERGIGVARDRERAFALYAQSAARGIVNGLYEIGRCLYYGLGVAPDRATAETYFRDARIAGHAEAAADAGDDGVPRRMPPAERHGTISCYARRNVKIAIVGAGALGTVFGARLAREHDVTILVRTEKTARAIVRRGGLIIDEQPPQRVAATHDPQRLAGRDLAIVAVKAFATIEALAPLRAIFTRDTIVVSIQNGIDAAVQIEHALGGEPAIAVGPTTEAARSLEPGVVLRASIGTTMLGWVPGRARDRTVLDELAATFTASGLETHATDDATPFLWGKLVVNAALNPVTALARVTNGEFARHPESLARGIAIAREVAALAALEGVTLPYADVAERVRAVANATARNRSSMLQDLERGRPTEIEAILGTVVRRAAAFGLPVPQSLAAYDEVRRCANA